MTRKTRLASLFLLSLLWNVALPSALAQAQSPRVTIKSMVGEVRVLKSGQVQSSAVAEGDQLEVHDEIQTGKEASVEMDVRGVGQLTLEENTTWTFERYRMEHGPTYFSGFLALGRLRSQIAKLPEGSTVQMSTPTSVAAVRGTSFSLFVYVVQQHVLTLLEVFEESVLFSNLQGDQSHVVREGESATADDMGRLTPPSKSEKQGERTTARATSKEYRAVLVIGQVEYVILTEYEDRFEIKKRGLLKEGDVVPELCSVCVPQDSAAILRDESGKEIELLGPDVFDLWLQRRRPYRKGRTRVTEGIVVVQSTITVDGKTKNVGQPIVLTRGSSKGSSVETDPCFKVVQLDIPEDLGPEGEAIVPPVEELEDLVDEPRPSPSS